MVTCALAICPALWIDQPLRRLVKPTAVSKTGFYRLLMTGNMFSELSYLCFWSCKSFLITLTVDVVSSGLFGSLPHECTENSVMDSRLMDIETYIISQVVIL